ncbi:MAG: hypothetical protein ABGY11_10410 [Candidatus Thioglobus sp.]|jgi:hypothetical protein
MKNRSWRKVKTIAMYLNRRQWERDFSLSETSGVEIQTEDGVYAIRTETSSSATPQYIITE